MATTNYLYVYTTPADTRVTLRPDSTGDTLIGQSGSWNGRDDAHRIRIPYDVNGGAELGITKEGYVNIHLRGVLSANKGVVSYSCDDFHLVQVATPIPPPEPEPEPGVDDIDLSSAVVASSDCPDVRLWSPISMISNITLSHAEQGYHMNFDGRDTWPGVIPPGWTGQINHTLWMCEKIGGLWYILPVKEGLGDYLTLGPILTPGQVPQNLTYYAQSPMNVYQPGVNEQVGFFCTTGDTRRMNIQPTSGASYARTNVKLVPFTAGSF